MNNLDKQYQALLQDIIDNGVTKKDRTGTGTISVFGRQIRHKMSEGFPLLTTKKMAFNTMVTELLWFLRGDTNIKFLVDNNCHIWDGDAYKNYLNVVTFEKPDYFHENHGHLKMSVKKEGDNYLPLTQEEFINRIKTDDKFSKKWGLNIEERELNLEERKQIVKVKYFTEFYWKIVDNENDDTTIFEMNKRNIPTKLITATYNNKTVNIYE